VGVVLSGMRDDGSAGLAVIKSRGGAAVVQDPDDALYGGMPMNAIAHVPVDAIAPITRVADAIRSLVLGLPLPVGVRGSNLELGPPATGRPLTLICPECGGVLTEHNETHVPQWRCHVGHLYSAESLNEEQGAAVEAALWTALRSLEDRAALMRRLSDGAVERGQPRSARLFRLQAEQSQQQADLLRDVVREAAAAAQRTYDGATHEPLASGEVT
jgi:two-component system, chemotaxis family, protein-glutamate methylesterase/glutaminase